MFFRRKLFSGCVDPIQRVNRGCLDCGVWLSSHRGVLLNPWVIPRQGRPDVRSCGIKHSCFVCNRDPMKSRFRVAFITFGLICLVPFRLVAEDRELIREAGAHFQKSCMTCHVPPDLRFATDRAWLGQIRETDWSGEAPKRTREALITFFRNNITSNSMLIY